ncbi:MAG: hypothetical protein KGH87_08205 [Thaumarchaeota archaeon]|nr:hypothetical protein [Nitrososphaerota archaeon]MDE1839886.1 hypothetical protein [Nitrososphaerota archaeon]
MVSQTGTAIDNIKITDNRMLDTPSPQGFLKPYAYLFYHMDVDIMNNQTPVVPIVNPPQPANMNISTKGFVS